MRDQEKGKLLTKKECEAGLRKLVRHTPLVSILHHLPLLISRGIVNGAPSSCRQEHDCQAVWEANRFDTMSFCDYFDIHLAAAKGNPL